MTIFSTADETRRLARESKEKGVPVNRDALAKIEGETGYYIDTFAETPSDSSTGDSTDESGATTDNTQENEPNETSGGDTATGGSSGSSGGTTKTTFDADSPMSMAQPEGSFTDADSLEDTDSAPTNGEPCIGCDVDKLDNITEGDCANTGGDSGDCFKIHYDGVFPTPEGWDDPETPPVDPTWLQGMMFRWQSNYHALFFDAVDNMVATRSALYAPDNYAEYQGHYPAFSVGGLGQYYVGIVIRRTSDDYAWTTETQNIYPVSCTPSEGSSSCPIDGPTLESWESDGCYDLIFDGTAFKGSDYDPDLPDKYKGAGTSKVDYCTGSGADGSTIAGVDGGFQIHTTDMMRYYDSDGNLKAAGDKTQTFIDQYKP